VSNQGPKGLPDERQSEPIQPDGEPGVSPEREPGNTPDIPEAERPPGGDEGAVPDPDFASRH
jgi:hypothetical protein